MSALSKGERTKRQIIERAFALSHYVGLEGISLAVLAADLKISKSGLFAHFASKEQLQLDVVQELTDRVIANVIVPAFKQPRGEPRIRALFEHYVRWVNGHDEGLRGCLLTALLYEYTDREGPVRDALLVSDRSWFETIVKACTMAVREGHFKASLDAEQFAYEWLGISMVFQQALRFFNDPRAEQRATAAFDSLIERSRA